MGAVDRPYVCAQTLLRTELGTGPAGPVNVNPISNARAKKPFK
jgi:hypothetical protein